MEEELAGLPDEEKKVLCHSCEKWFCPFCKVPFHFGTTCAKYKDWVEKNNQADALTEAALQAELAAKTMKVLLLFSLSSTSFSLFLALSRSFSILLLRLFSLALFCSRSFYRSSFFISLSNFVSHFSFLVLPFVTLSLFQY